MCRDCRNRADRERHQRWAAAHPEAAAQRHRSYEERNNGERRRRWHEDQEYRALMLRASARYRAKNRDTLRAKMRARWRSVRETVIARYGGCCACCGERRYEFLALDHANGGGSRERRGASGAVSALYRRLAVAPALDPAFRVLCHNCNQAVGLYGYCPHTIADPDDAGQMDVVGFDTAAPTLIADFARD